MGTFFDWVKLYSLLIVSPVFQRVKGVAEVNLLVNTRFFLFVIALTTGRIEAALAAGVHDLAAGLTAVGEGLTTEEIEFWNDSLTACGFAANSPARL